MPPEKPPSSREAILALRQQQGLRTIARLVSARGAGDSRRNTQQAVESEPKVVAPTFRNARAVRFSANMPPSRASRQRRQPLRIRSLRQLEPLPHRQLDHTTPKPRLTPSSRRGGRGQLRHFDEGCRLVSHPGPPSSARPLLPPLFCPPSSARPLLHKNVSVDSASQWRAQNAFCDKPLRSYGTSHRRHSAAPRR